MASTHGKKYGISQLFREMLRPEVNLFRFSDESKLIHFFWQKDSGEWAGKGAPSYHERFLCHQSALLAGLRGS